MLQGYKNKVVKTTENKKVEENPREEEYFFSEYGITIKATSQQEAEAKLKAELQKVKKK